VAGDHDLRRRVEIHRFHDAARRRRFRADCAHGVVVETEDRGHAALADRHRVLHRLRAKTHERHCVTERERAGRDERRIFTEAVARDDRGRRAAGLLPRAVHRIGGGQHHWLRVRGQVQLFGRTLGDQLAEILAERVGRFLERLAHDSVVGEGIEHADRLRALPGKNEREFHDCPCSINSYADTRARRAPDAPGRRPAR
jgi:hypothetical protein